MTEQTRQNKFQNWRLYLVLLAMLVCVGAIVWKTSSLHIRDRDFLQGQGDARTIRTVPLVANRGLITDRNGEPLAVSTPVKSIWVDPGEVAGSSATINTLAAELELNADVLATTIRSHAEREFLYVKRRLAAGRCRCDSGYGSAWGVCATGVSALLSPRRGCSASGGIQQC